MTCRQRWWRGLRNWSLIKALFTLAQAVLSELSRLPHGNGRRPAFYTKGNERSEHPISSAHSRLCRLTGHPVAARIG